MRLTALAAFTGLGLTAAAQAGTPASAATVDTNTVGVVCTTGTTFDMETSADYINLPDGNTAYMYGYNLVGKPFQHPGPVLCVNEGDTVTITLHNTLRRDVSMVFPGQENVLANGLAAQPQFSGTDMTSLTNVATAAAANGTGGGTVTYSFVAAKPGTYLYESGTDPDIQVHMGLFGALIVRPTTAPAVGEKLAYNRADSNFLAKNEFMVLLSEIDPYLNQAIENGDSKPVITTGTKFTLANFKPRYWLVNGRGFPDSIADNGASFLPKQPYGSLARVKPSELALTHYLNVGTEDFPFHPHANNGTIIGRDGQPLTDGAGADASYEGFVINIGPGQTYDVQFSWHDAENYSPSNPVPVEVPQVANQVFGVFYSGSPYLGVVGPQPPGNQTLNQCGEYYIISHNHALYQITSWGVNMTGPITYMRIDPPTGTCP
jgi:FtsP/CotA-like multicopper oxidase with cupredoxin domain